jgi:hypothetical protein
VLSAVGASACSFNSAAACDRPVCPDGSGRFGQTLRLHYRRTLRRTRAPENRHSPPPFLSIDQRSGIAMAEFPRIKRLPPYVFNITGELKMAARRAGIDIIDMSMGNPDGPTPRHIVDKLVEAAQRQDTHGYSVSKGIPRLRRAIVNWYKARYDVDFDADAEAIVTIGSKEGLAHLMLATLDRGDTVLVPNPELPDPHLRRDHRRRRYPLGANGWAGRLFHRARARDPRVVAEAENDDPRLPEQSDRAMRRARFLPSRHCTGQAARDLRRA